LCLYNFLKSVSVSEFENDAETLVKDMEFGLVMAYGGNQQPERPEQGFKTEDPSKSAEHDNQEPEFIPDEDEEDLELKLAILDIYNERYDRRVETKALIFDRALVDYKKVKRLVSVSANCL